MPLTAFVDKMLDILSKRPLPLGADAELFRRFAQAVGRQIRRPYLARRTPQGASDDVVALWSRLAVRASDEPSVQGEQEGRWASITSVMPDQPFIMDTLRLTVDRSGATNLGGLNVVIPVGRDDSGAVARIDDPRDGLESAILVEVEDLEADGAATLIAAITRGLRLAQATVSAFAQASSKVEAAASRFARAADRLAEQNPAEAERMAETAELLRWLLADNFVFMAVIEGDDRLGMASGGTVDIWDGASLQGGWTSSGIHAFVEVRKGSAESPVHRSGRVDELRVVSPDADGKALHIQGLFTYRAVTQASRHVPLLRRVLADILRTEQSKPGSYRYKGIANVFDSLPTEFLFSTSTAEITVLVDQVLEAEHEHTTRTHVKQTEQGTTFALVAMPRERFSDRLRQEVQDSIVAATGASYTDHGVFLGRYQTLLVHYYLTGTRELSVEAKEKLSARIAELSTPWEEQVFAELRATAAEAAADELVLKFSDGFPEIYRQKVSPAQAAADVRAISGLSASQPIDIAVNAHSAEVVHLRIYQARHILLSDILPVLDNFGLVVIDQFSDSITAAGGEKYTVDTFRLQGVAGLSSADLVAAGPLLADAIKAVTSKKMANDALNRILLRSMLPWTAVDLFRAYYAYARQIGMTYPLTRFTEILVERPISVGLLWRYFQDRFDPAFSGDRDAAMALTREAFFDRLREVADNEQDVVLRTLFNLMESSLRTNFYRTDKKEHYISFKLDHNLVKNLPSPRMKFEIYVHHHDVEGTHLRGGKVARGGIRWSDRVDFRREVLGLVNTQMVKNVVIVPEGSKGGFLMKHNPPTPAARRQRADELYQIFIRGLLDVTDNIVGGSERVRPKNVVCHDEFDPYLVVAADKGTAHLSDTANAISQEYGFWLDDAFASGGSFGYDHKKVGITARGGWMTARRHFYEMGVDPWTTEFTAVGVGDTAGDVFGNGVIEHPTMRLLAAFNHMHIFLDPNPNTEASAAERNRLFYEVKGWDAYNTAIISKGGGIFSRRAKSIPLSPEVQAMFGVTVDELPVDAVIRHILRMPVDLLWNGGIGTYVKATFETHQDAGDPSSDDLRVNATELRCKMVGEGGNLGFTQAARVEYAQHGGRINTDAIDNSGGVDMSDHEVNLKILLNPLMASGRMTRDERNVLLESLTSTVADDVLRNNDLHGRLLSLDQVRSQHDPVAYSPTIEWVCQMGNISREALRLPTEAELIARSAKRQGLTRPELAVLQAHVKMHLFRDLKDADASIIPGFAEKVQNYFPAKVREGFAADIANHMLQQSIGMTVTCNEVVNEAGAQFFPLMLELTGASPVQVAATWSAAMRLVGAWELRAELEAGTGSFEGRYKAWIAVTDAVQSLVSLWLGAGEPGPKVESAEGIRAALTALIAQGGAAVEGRVAARAEALVNGGVAPALARRIASLGEIVAAREIALLAAKGEITHAVVVRYVTAGEASRLAPTLRALEARLAATAWDPVALGIVRNRYVRLQRELVDAARGIDPRQGVDDQVQTVARRDLAGLAELVGRVLGDQPALAALLVADERVRAWIGRYRAEA
jgi:glutamate dehydrogenase